MTLDQALEILEIYAIERNLDSLAGVEHMVRNLKTFFSKSRESARSWIAFSYAAIHNF